MKPIERVAIVGLGLIGGSLARALAARDVRVLGYDSAPDSLDAAEGEGIVQERLGAQLDGIETADVVVIALPVDATLAALPRMAPRLGESRLVMDVASTKRSIVAAAESAGIGARFIGAHPLTGSHRSGWRASRATLFDEARVFLCPTSTSTPDALQLAETFWRGLRAGVEVLDAATHDEQMAWRSHLPHVLSVALALTLRDAGIQRSALGPGRARHDATGRRRAVAVDVDRRGQRRGTDRRARRVPASASHPARSAGAARQRAQRATTSRPAAIGSTAHPFGRSRFTTPERILPA